MNLLIVFFLPLSHIPSILTSLPYIHIVRRYDSETIEALGLCFQVQAADTSNSQRSRSRCCDNSPLLNLLKPVPKREKAL